MTYDQAQKILNLVREGHNYPPRIVDFALFLTGDFDAYEAYRGEGMAGEIQTQGQDGRGRAGPDLVGWDHRGY